jgi:hypothetical protein
VVEVIFLARAPGWLRVFVRVRAAGDDVRDPVPEAGPDLGELRLAPRVLRSVLKESRDHLVIGPVVLADDGGHRQSRWVT